MQMMREVRVELVHLQIPLWPFTTLSFGLGFLSLGLYFALWKPSAEIEVPPTQQNLVRG